MAYYVFHIPSHTIPNSLTEIKESVYCFPSKEIDAFTDYGIKACLCLAIKADTDSIVEKIIRDFIIVQNIFGQNYDSIKWFSGVCLSSQTKIYKSIADIYYENKSEVRYLMTHFNYAEMPLLLLMPEPPMYLFIETFNRLHNITETDFLYKSLSYLAVVNPIMMITQKIFNNALFENTLQFQLFESIMKEYDTTPKVKTKPCLTCDYTKQKGLSQRIDDFFNLDEYKSLKSKTEIVASIKAIAKSRHIFSHKLEGKSHKAYYEEDLAPNLGSDSTFYLKDDIKYAHGTLTAIHTIKSVNTLILIGKLFDK